MFTLYSLLPTIILSGSLFMTRTSSVNEALCSRKFKTSSLATQNSCPLAAQVVDPRSFIFPPFRLNRFSSTHVEVAAVSTGENKACLNTVILTAISVSSSFPCHRTGSLQVQTFSHLLLDTTTVGLSYQAGGFGALLPSPKSCFAERFLSMSAFLRRQRRAMCPLFWY